MHYETANPAPGGESPPATAGETPAATALTSTAYKWAPVIAHDACTGCGLCVNACDRGCLEMIWDFATFKRAEDCGSCGHCQEVCRHDVIRMGWVKATGDLTVGRWRDEAEPSAAPGQPKHWLSGFFAKQS